jgi:hypothetical protein
MISCSKITGVLTEKMENPEITLFFRITLKDEYAAKVR